MKTVAAERRDRNAWVGGARGETLIELLATVAILGIAVVAIVFGMGVAVKASGTDRKQGRMENLLRNGAEAISAAEYNRDGTYSLGPNSGQLIIGAPRCLDVNGATATCDTGVQELTLTAQIGGSSKSLVIVKRDAAPFTP